MWVFCTMVGIPAYGKSSLLWFTIFFILLHTTGQPQGSSDVHGQPEVHESKEGMKECINYSLYETLSHRAPFFPTNNVQQYKLNNRVVKIIKPIKSNVSY